MSQNNAFIEKQNYSTSLPGFHFFRSSADRDTPQVERVAKRIYQNRHAILREAEKEVGTDNSKEILIVFYKKINQQFGKENIKLSDIAENKYATQFFASSTSLSTVWKIHMQIIHLQAKENRLEAWAKDIFDKRDQLWAAVKKSSQTDEQCLKDFFIMLIEELKKNGFEIEELLNNHKACEYFRKSSRLTFFLDRIASHYAENNNHGKHGKVFGAGEVSPEIDHDKHRPNEVKRLAQAHAKDGIGIMTRLGLKGRDEAELAPAARQIVLKNHPDKNPDGDKVIYEAAKDLLGLIKEGLLNVYRQALDKARSLD